MANAQLLGVIPEGNLRQPTGALQRIYSRITPEAVLRGGDERPLPVLLRAEITEVLLPMAKAREKLAPELHSSVAGIDPALLGRSTR